MKDTFKSKLSSGFFWQGTEKIGSYGIRFVVSIILARLLSPEEFGIIAIMMVFLGLSNLLIDSGFSAALVQKQDIDDIDCCSVFYINILVSFLLYGCLCLFAPFIASYYEMPKLSLYIPIFSLIIIFQSFAIVQIALLRKRMQFNICFRINWTALLLSGTVGILMAYSGYGVWSLIFQQLINYFTMTLLYWLLVKWRPKLRFNWNRIAFMFNFGWKVFCSDLLNAIYYDLYTLIIGKVSDLKTLSYYDRGKTFPKYGMDVINTTISSVLLPAFSTIQNDSLKMRSLAQNSLKNVSFFVVPVLSVLFVFADEIVVFVFTEKWLPCVPFMRLCCLTFFFWPIHTINLYAIMSTGRSDVYLKLEIARKLQAIVLIAITYRFGIITMVAGGILAELIAMLENTWYNGRMINYSFLKQIRDIIPVLIISLFSISLSFFVSKLLSDMMLHLIIGLFCYSLLYLALSMVFGIIPEELLTLFKKTLKTTNVF